MKRKYVIGKTAMVRFAFYNRDEGITYVDIECDDGNEYYDIPMRDVTPFDEGAAIAEYLDPVIEEDTGAVGYYTNGYEKFSVSEVYERYEDWLNDERLYGVSIEVEDED